MRYLLAGCILLITSCAHPIRIIPDLNSLEAPKAAVSARKIALSIDPTLKNQEVTTSGSGGDLISYFPYRDLETGIFKVLNDHFQSVQLASVPAAEHTYDLVAVPRIETQSSGSNIATWMPTDFTVRIKLDLKNAEGKIVWSETGEGRSQDSELPADGKLRMGEIGAVAANRALLQLSQKLEKFER